MLNANYNVEWGINEFALQWRHNDRDWVSNHQPRGCLLNRLFRRRSQKTSKLRVTGLCVGNSPGPVNSPHKGPATRKMFPFDDVIMESVYLIRHHSKWSTRSREILPMVEFYSDTLYFPCRFVLLMLKKVRKYLFKRVWPLSLISNWA